ncbi:MAG: alpha/beta hydrolase [Myxococcota bacterium]
MTKLAQVRVRGRDLRIEYAWVGFDDGAPLLVFLHEGLGSISAWRTFPDRLCRAAGARGLVYSRPGYGQSTLRLPDERWPATFLEDHARDVLPALFDAIGLDAATVRPWLFGHSDGASIALAFAARSPEQVGGLVLLAPHLFVEDVSIEAITLARAAYLTGDLRSKLARHHADPDSAFFGWCDVWLDPAFRRLDLRPHVARIGCPVLAIQGFDDPYGTMAQIEAVAVGARQTWLVRLPQCGHAPHRDQAEAVIDATLALLR